MSRLSPPEVETINALANLIKSKFDQFTFTTGHTAYTYNHPGQGFNRSWGFYNSQSDAMRLYEQLLDLQQFSPDWKRLTTSSVVEPGDRFIEPGEIVWQAGVSIRVPPERPVAPMRFWAATLKFPHIHKATFLVDFRGNLGDVAGFLAKFAP